MAQDRASAEELFQLGKGAMARQELTKACNYFQASLNAEFALGTLLNLAICHEQAGKIASAWAEYRTLEDRSRRATPPQIDRAQFAHDHAEALRPRLSRVRLIISKEAAAITGLVVKIDGVAVASELFDAGVPVDPGKRRIETSAPGHETSMQILAVDDERLKLETTIAPLQKSAAKTPPPPNGGNVDLAEIERISAERSKRTVGFVVGGIGIASLATGAVVGLIALGKVDESRCPAPCFATKAPNSTEPNPALVDAQDGYRSVNTLAWVSNVTLAAGLLGLGIGAYLVLTAHPEKPSSSTAPAVNPRALRIMPTPLLNGAALTVGGTL